jgi:hypothetical protein
MTYQKICRVLLAACLLPACAGDKGDDPSSLSEPDPNAISNTETALLSATDVGYGTIEFSKQTMSDKYTTTLVITEKASAYLRSTPMDALMSQRLTTLEIFLAVNPGSDVPEDLVKAHADETVRLGRATPDVVHAIFDRNAPVEKSSAACDNWVFAPRTGCQVWGKKLRLDFISGTPTVVLPLGNSTNDFSYLTMSFAALGACNESSGTIFDRSITSQNNGATWNFSPWNEVAPGVSIRHWINVSTKGPDRCGSPISVACPHPAAYREQGWGSSLDLRTAEELSDPNCIR